MLLKIAIALHTLWVSYYFRQTGRYVRKCLSDFCSSGAATKEAIEESGLAMTDIASLIKALKQNVSQVESLACEDFEE
jgi:hypothetical protein